MSVQHNSMVLQTTASKMKTQLNQQLSQVFETHAEYRNVQI